MGGSLNCPGRRDRGRMGRRGLRRRGVGEGLAHLVHLLGGALEDHVLHGLAEGDAQGLAPVLHLEAVQLRKVRLEPLGQGAPARTAKT